MGETDAFGREVGEDPLAGLGWSAPEQEEDREPPRPAPASVSASPERVPGARAQRVGCAATVVLLALTAAMVVGIGFWASGLEDDDEVVSSSPSTVALTPEPVAPEPEAAPPVGLARGSLLLRPNLARVLGRLRTSGKGRLRSLRVAPDRVNVQLLTKDGRLRNVQVDWDGELDDYGAGGPGFGFVDTVPFGSVDAAAPSRAVTRAARRLRTGAARIDYVVSTGDGWSVFFKGGQAFSADDRGRIVRRIS